MFPTSLPTPLRRWEKGAMFVSTIGDVSDGECPYETAIKHPDYNDGHIIIVAKYDTEEAAIEGHIKWVDMMVSGNLPEEIKDCCNSAIQKVGEAFGLPTSFERRTKH